MKSKPSAARVFRGLWFRVMGLGLDISLWNSFWGFCGEYHERGSCVAADIPVTLCLGCGFRVRVLGLGFSFWGISVE